MNNDLVWVASKVKQFLEKGPYVLDYCDCCYGKYPSLIYKKFIITVEDEDTITIGFQPMMLNDGEEERLIDKLKQIVTNVNMKEL